MIPALKKLMEKVEIEVIKNPTRAMCLRSTHLEMLVNMMERRFNLLTDDDLLIWQALMIYGLLETIEQNKCSY